jgi:thiamine biosynthesis lipoprotein
LTRLRRSSREVSESAWHEARSRCGWEHIELDRDQQRLRLHRPGVLLDFGAIGKGFVIDRIGESLQALGISSFSINASGNLLCGEPIASDPPGRGEVGWPISIGVLGEPQRELKRLRLSRCGIATSGDQNQRFRNAGAVDATGPTSSHIVDPVLRRGLDQSHMATVIAPQASDADALATACCVHMQRGSLSSWLARAQSELPHAEYVFQSWRDAGIAYTSVACDW